MAKEEKKLKNEKKIKKENKHFFKDFKAELKKVIWPTSKQLVNNTIVVITIVLITAAIVFVLDFVFASLNTYGIDKIKAKVESNKESIVQENVIQTVPQTSEETNNSTEDGSVTE